MQPQKSRIQNHQNNIQDQVKIKKEKALFDRKQELVTEFIELKKKQDIQVVSQKILANNDVIKNIELEFFDLFNELSQKNELTRSYLKTQREQFIDVQIPQTSIPRESETNMKQSSLVFFIKLQNKQPPQAETQPKIPNAEDLELEIQDRLSQIESQQDIQNGLLDRCQETKFQINKLVKLNASLKDTLSIAKRKFTSLYQSESVAVLKEVQTSSNLENVTKNIQDLENEKINFLTNIIQIKQKLGVENEQDHTNVALTQLRIQDIKLNEAQQHKEILKLEAQESQIMMKMIDSKYIIEEVEAILNLEEVFMQENDQDILKSIEHYQKQTSEINLMTHQIEKGERRNALSYKPTDPLQAENQKIDRKAIIRKTFYFFDTHPEGPNKLVESLVMKYRSFVVLKQSQEQRYNECLEEKKDKCALLDKLDIELGKVSEIQFNLIHLKLEGKGLVSTQTEKKQKERNKLIRQECLTNSPYRNHQILEQHQKFEDYLINQEEDLDEEELIYPKIEEQQNNVSKNIVYFKEEFDIRQKFLLTVYFSFFEMVSRFIHNLKIRFHQLNKIVIQNMPKQDVMLEKLYKDTSELSQSIKLGLKIKKQIHLKNQPSQESSFQHFLNSAQYIPLELQELVQSFLSVYANQFNKSQKWAFLLKQNIMVLIILSKEEIEKYLLNISQQFEDQQQAGEYALENMSTLLDESQTEFQFVIKKLMDQTCSVIRSYQKQIKIKSTSNIIKQQEKLKLLNESYLRYQERACQQLQNYKSEDNEFNFPLIDRQPVIGTDVKPSVDSTESDMLAMLNTLVQKQQSSRKNKHLKQSSDQNSLPSGQRQSQALEKIPQINQEYQLINEEQNIDEQREQLKTALFIGSVQSSPEQFNKPQIKKKQGHSYLYSSITQQSQSTPTYSLKKILQDQKALSVIKKLEQQTHNQEFNLVSREQINQYVPTQLQAQYRTKLELKRHFLPSSHQLGKNNFSSVPQTTQQLSVPKNFFKSSYREKSKSIMLPRSYDQLFNNNSSPYPSGRNLPMKVNKTRLSIMGPAFNNDTSVNGIKNRNSELISPWNKNDNKSRQSTFIKFK